MTAAATPFVFFVAGEPSGDWLGAMLIAALRRRCRENLRVAGVGGEAMEAAGLKSLVPLSDLAVMGLAEVLPRAPLILRRVKEVVAAILELHPDAVVTIDSSGFCWRIAAALRRRGERVPLIHYVAPMVWAWRPGRARRIARLYDHLIALLPFEPPFFEKEGLSCSYLGHPVTESGADRGDGARFRAAHGLASDERVIAVLPGSRSFEVGRLLPIFGAALAGLEPLVGPFRVVVPTVRAVEEKVAEATRLWPGRPILVSEPAAKYDAFAASRAALCASGSVALELAMARLPMVVAYRVHPLTEALLRRVVKVGEVNLVNLLLGRRLVGEFLGRECTPVRLAAGLAALVLDEEVRARHLAGYDEAIRRLKAGERSPSLNAADRILEILAARRCGERAFAPHS
jgi:lipid-A-disaccharide synthase